MEQMYPRAFHNQPLEPANDIHRHDFPLYLEVAAAYQSFFEQRGMPVHEVSGSYIEAPDAFLAFAQRAYADGDI